MRASSMQPWHSGSLKTTGSDSFAAVDVPTAFQGDIDEA